MPRKSKSSTKPKTTVNWEQLRELWTAIPVQDWLVFLQHEAPEGKWTRTGNTITGRCPYHDDHTPSLKLTFPKRLGKCFGCGKAITDIVQLVAKVTGQTYMSALIRLNNEFKLDNILQDKAQDIATQYEIEEMKKETALAYGKLAEEYVRDHPDYLSYMDAGATYLETGRNVPMSLVSNLPVGLFGKPEHVKKYIPAEHHQQFDDYFKDAYNACPAGSVVFWYNDSPGTISNFKIRKLSMAMPGIAATLKDITQVKPQTAKQYMSKDFYVVKDPIKRPIGVYGLHHYSRLLSESSTMAVITEGEFDALSVMASQVKNNCVTDFPIFAGGGGAGTAFSFLRDCWIRTLLVVTDAPGTKHGIELAYNWMCSAQNHVGNPPIQYKIFMWDMEMQGVAGDLDDAVQHFGYDYIKDKLWVNRDNNYLSQLPWVQDMCDDAITAVNTEYDNLIAQASGENAVSNLKADRVSKIRQTLTHWLKALSDSIDKNQFISYASVQTGIDLSVDDELYRDANNLDSFDGAVRAISQALFEIVSIPYYTEGAKGSLLHTIYCKQTGECISLSLSSDSAVNMFFSKCVRKDHISWLKDILHNASTITPTEEEVEKKYFNNPTAKRADEKKRAGLLMEAVFNQHSANCENVNNLVRIGQGIHYKDVPKNNHLYLVNGSDVYKGTFSADNGNVVQWEQLHDIRDGRYCFEIAKSKQWSLTIKDSQDLYDGANVDLHELYTTIVSLLDGWLFENHDIMKCYIASWILSIPIQLAIQKVNVTFITGESTSGKTSFAQGLLGGVTNNTNDIPSILEPANVVTDSSAAYIYQSANGSSALVNIDEAETNEDSDHNKRMQEITKMLYSIPTGGSCIGRGTASNSGGVTYNLQAPVLCAAIRLPQDDTFLTRIIVIYTKKDYRRRNISNIIADLLNGRDVNDIRKKISTCMLSRIPQLIKRTNELETEFSTIPTDPPVTSRFITAVATATAIYEMCGTKEDPHDPRKLFMGMVESNRSRLETVYTADAKSNLLSTVLYARVINAFTGTNNTVDKVAPRDLLIRQDTDSINILNNSSCGVYCLQSKQWLVFYWRQIKSSILNVVPNSFRDSSESSLRENISKNKYLVTAIGPKKHAEIINALNLPDAKSTSEYSVVKLNYLFELVEQENFEQMEDSQGISFDI